MLLKTGRKNTAKRKGLNFSIRVDLRMHIISRLIISSQLIRKVKNTSRIIKKLLEKWS